MPKRLILYAVVAAVIFAFYIGFKVYGAQKLKKEKNLTDPSQMSVRKYTKSFSVKGRLDGKEWKNLADWFQANQARIIDGDRNSKIVYSGESASAQYGGILNVPAEQMPIRMIFIQNGDNLDVRMDEDFGFQMFAGPAKAAFVEKTQQAFVFFEENIRKGLA